MKQQFSALIVTCALLAGCATSRHKPAVVSSRTDLAHNPTLLFNSFDVSTVTLAGVRIGDRASAVVQDVDRPSSDPAWVINSSGNRYRIESEKVVALGLWDSSALDRLNLTTPADIEKQFGKPESVDKRFHFFGGNFRAYRYKNFTVIWNDLEDRVVGINVSR